MSKESDDWRIAAGVVRFPEDNDVVGVPIDAIQRSATQSEADDLAFTDICLGELASRNPDMQGIPLIVHYAHPHRSIIAKAPWIGLPPDPFL